MSKYLFTTLPTNDRGLLTRSLPIATVRAEEVRAKVRQVLADPAYASNARRISEKLRTYGGAVEAAQLIEGTERLHRPV